MQTTFQGIQMMVDYITEEIRQRAIDDLVEKFKVAARKYYTDGYDSGETVNLIKQLEDLGVGMDVIIDMDFDIRDEVLSDKNS